jgi:hypothetical protein
MVPGVRAMPRSATSEGWPPLAAMKQASLRSFPRPPARSGWRDFTATHSPMARSRALTTTPDKPTPSSPSSSYEQALPMRPVLGLPSAAVAATSSIMAEMAAARLEQMAAPDFRCSSIMSQMEATRVATAVMSASRHQLPWWRRTWRLERERLMVVVYWRLHLLQN